MKTLIAIILISLLFLTGVFNQVKQDWVATYNCIEHDSLSIISIRPIENMVLDNHGNVYISGEIEGSDLMKYIVTIKYNFGGSMQWFKRYNISSSPHAMTIDKYNNVYIVGYSLDSLRWMDYVVIKYDSSGIQQWVSTYNGTSSRHDIANAVVVDDSGNVYVTGKSAGNTPGFNFDIITVKYDASGNQLWAVRDSSIIGESEYAIAMDIDKNTNVYIAGKKNKNGDVCSTIKYNSFGIKQWEQTYRGNYNGSALPMSIKTDSFDNIYVLANTYRIGGGGGDFAVIKYTTDGILAWISTYNAEDAYYSVEKAHSMIIDKKGNVYVTGTIDGEKGVSDYVTVKFNSYGKIVWTTSYDNIKRSDISYSITLDNLGSVYITGSSYGNINGEDIATIKYDSLGNQVWIMKYDNHLSGSDGGTKILTDSTGNVYVLGYSANNWEFVTIKYSQEIVTINELNINNSIKIHPNPNNGQFTLTIQNPQFIINNSQLIISNLLGQTVYQQTLNTELEIVNTKLMKGVYLLQLQSEQGIINKKIIIQ